MYTLKCSILQRSFTSCGNSIILSLHPRNDPATAKHLVICIQTCTATSADLLDLLKTETHRVYASNNTSKPPSLRNSSAFKAEQCTVWYASSLAAASNGADFENNRSSSVSSLIVLIS